MTETLGFKFFKIKSNFVGYTHIKGTIPGPSYFLKVVKANYSNMRTYYYGIDWWVRDNFFFTDSHVARTAHLQ